MDAMPVRQELYTIAVLQNDPAAAQHHVHWAEGKPDEDLMLDLEADAAAYVGKRRLATELRHRSAEMARQRSQMEAEVAAGRIAAGAVQESRFGNCPQARREIEAALALHREGSERQAAYVLAQCGDAVRAEAFINDLVRRFPLDTLLNDVTVPNVLAMLQISHANVSGAIELLRKGERFETGNNLGGGMNDDETFVTTYTRGMAYLKGNAGKEAATEFEKIIANRNRDPFALIHALSYLQLGRASVLAGEKDKARSAYQDFLALWKDADPDLPPLVQAKAEYAKLK
jgi:tetratricopeptide (TPR) repeat protein